MAATIRRATTMAGMAATMAPTILEDKLAPFAKKGASPA
jgi:hypothetical protein